MVIIGASLLISMKYALHTKYIFLKLVKFSNEKINKLYTYKIHKYKYIYI